MTADTKKPYLEIGKRLRAIRGLTDLTAKDFAEACGFNETQYSNWENGYRRPLPEAAAVLVDKFGVTMDFIYLGRDTALPYNLRTALSSSPSDKNQRKSKGKPDL